jgi:hypothetical protein
MYNICTFVCVLNRDFDLYDYHCLYIQFNEKKNTHTHNLLYETDSHYGYHSIDSENLSSYYFVKCKDITKIPGKVLHLNRVYQ